MAEKTFKTHDDLIVLLESRGIDFSCDNSKSAAKKHLQRTGYYNLINGYKDMFLQPGSKDSYIPGTTVDEIFALYEFDRLIRGVFLEYILTIETNVKSLIAYEFSQNHGHKNYLLSTNFNNSSKQSVKQVVALIAEIQRQTANNVSDPAIEHYLTVHGYVPLWVLNNILTFGTISKFYSLMKQNERQAIAKVFSVDDKEFESFLFYLSKVRNFCAHGNRLYCYRSRNPIADTPIHSKMNIPLASTEYAYGKRDLFACLIVLKMMLSNRDFKSLCNNLEGAIQELSKHMKVLSVNDILQKMGFPPDWKKIKRIIK